MTTGLRNRYTTPTEEQAALVGHIVLDWSVVEWCLKMLAGKLAGAPDYPVRALTDQATARQMVGSCKTLLRMHEERYHDKVLPYEHRLAVKAAVDQVERVRERRNAFAHWIAWRENDDAFVMTRITSLHQPMETLSTAKLQDLARDVRGALEAIELAVTLVPETQERPAAPSNA